jgi:hypothetical protein
MQTQSFDFGDSRAKLVRAKKNLETLKSEVKRILNERCPYTYTIGEIDPESGWCSITMNVRELPELELGAILGDFMTNLRSSLNFAVNDLARASGVRPTDQHKFPIYASAAAYAREVGSATAAKDKGPLGGIVVGLGIIEKLQPYHAGAAARHHPYALIQRFSNADKHSGVARLVPSLSYPAVGTEPDAVERVNIPLPPAGSHCGPAFEVARLRFDRPFPTRLKLKTYGTTSVVFMSNPIRKEKIARGISPNTFADCYASVLVLLLELSRELDAL